MIKSRNNVSFQMISNNKSLKTKLLIKAITKIPYGQLF